MRTVHPIYKVYTFSENIANKLDRILNAKGTGLIQVLRDYDGKPYLPREVFYDKEFRQIIKSKLPDGVTYVQALQQVLTEIPYVYDYVEI